MKSRLNNCFFLMLLSFLSVAQNNWYHYNWTAEKNENLSQIYNNALGLNLNRYKNNIYIGEHYKKFADESALDLCVDVSDGNIYSSLEGYEAYVKKVLCTLITDTSITNHVEIKFYRSEDVQATMDGNGVMRLYIGILTELNTEAELAMVLGHEVAHFMNEDALTNYGRRMEFKYQATYGGFLGTIGLGQFIQSITSLREYYRFNREQEAAADLFSVKLMKESPYSLSSGITILRSFKRMETRWKIIYGKRNKFYSTHPDPGDRIKKAKLFGADPEEKKKRSFVVDSVSFMKLKELCFQETVNTCLMENNLSDLITLTFTRYLLEPENANNLAVLIEALRRELFFGKDRNIFNRSFILSRYQTPAILTSKNYAFLNQKNPSILNYLDWGFVNIWKEDTNKIKAKDLLDQQTTEFTTYIEAYLYFKEKARAMNNGLAGHYKYFGEHSDFQDAEKYVKMNSLFSTNDYISEKGKTPAFTKNMVVLMPYSADQLSGITELYGLKNYNSANYVMLQSVQNRLGREVLKFTDFNAEDRHLIISLLYLSKFYCRLDANRIFAKQKINWMELAPELYSFFKKYDVANLYICSTGLSRKNDKVPPNVLTEFYAISPFRKDGYLFRAQRRFVELAFTDQGYPNFEPTAAKLESFYKFDSK